MVKPRREGPKSVVLLHIHKRRKKEKIKEREKATPSEKSFCSLLLSQGARGKGFGMVPEMERDAESLIYHGVRNGGLGRTM